jgi:hypothetical protein
MASRNGKRAADQVHTVDSGPLSTRKGTAALKKRPNKRGSVGKRSRKEQTNGRAEEEWNVPLMLDRDELVALLEERLTDFATDVGLRVACLLFDKQVNISCKRAASGRGGPERRLSAATKTR